MLESSHAAVRAMTNWALGTGGNLGQRISYSREEPGGTSMPPSTWLRRLIRCQLPITHAVTFWAFSWGEAFFLRPWC